MRWDRQNIFLLAGPFRYKRRGEFVTVGFVSTYFTVILLGFEMFFFSFFFFFFITGSSLYQAGFHCMIKKRTFSCGKSRRAKRYRVRPILLVASLFLLAVLLLDQNQKNCFLINF